MPVGKTFTPREMQSAGLVSDAAWPHVVCKPCSRSAPPTHPASQTSASECALSFFIICVTAASSMQIWSVAGKTPLESEQGQSGGPGLSLYNNMGGPVPMHPLRPTLPRHPKTATRPTHTKGRRTPKPLKSA
ncbi:hypothetical protein DQ04_16501000 [Trypanosoma grayi]|uniref:hypothetical protein n=1 Tax=Trypanosoma grayi TaxID=71804 RepID=UPI0004F4AFB9|nr:hypothetical protein DQ04_16501000 [Trypanosoma grayi]KEG06016.1 hypothetical protein DQ04_16501000 [Trypanosoma grayi]